MVTYDFYENEYRGCHLTKETFPVMMARAEDWLKMLERTCSVTCYGPDSRAMALCSVAETMWVYDRRREVSEASVGSVRVRYRTSERSLQRQLLQNAGTFLEIHRGVC